MRKMTFCLICLFLLGTTIFCKRDANPIIPADEYQYQVPVQTDDGWETASLASVGMDERPLQALMRTLAETEDHRIHSVVIVKAGKLVFEEYFEGDKFNLAQPTGETGFDRDDAHNLCSATKSFTSALIGIALDRGYIDSASQRIFDFFPEYRDLTDSTPEKASITVEHLLTMTSGLQWDDETYSYFDSRNDMYQLFNASDPIRYILSRPLIETPGTFFAYRNCNTNLLGEIIRRACGLRLDTFSDNYMFTKLGITDFEWQMLPNDVVFCSGDLRLRPRDMAKFGFLFLNGGIWQGKRIISQAWVELSTEKQEALQQPWEDLDGYAYQWWIWEDLSGKAFHAYAASGWGGQWIIVIPGHDLVIVTTGGNYYTETQLLIHDLLADYFIPAMST